jgi:hypothetical protein
MNWPSHTDYQDAMQNPAVCFQEPELKSGEPKVDMLGLPRVMSGNFASVYELNCTDRRWAVRCFVRQVPGQQGRYARLSQHLNSMTMPCLVPFEYMLKGILVKGEWYPIVKMHLVDGSPLNAWVEENLNNPPALLKLAEGWRATMKDLNQHKLAHGDLQHGNVMVTPDNELRLVDYDGMYAPVFGRGRAPELGHINFQHPRRTADFYQEDLDNFSALVIYTSLRALAADPGLWQKYYTVDNLVLASADFKNPLNSPAFQQLKQSTDSVVQQLSGLLEKCCLASVENVPDFLVVMEALDQNALASVAMKTPAQAAQNISFSRPAPEVAVAAAKAAGAKVTVATVPPGTTGSRPGSRPAETGSRSAYDNVRGASTQPLKQSRPAPQQSRSAYPSPAEEKGGVPWWAWAVIGAVVLGIIVLVLAVNRPSSATDTSAPEESAPASKSNPTPEPEPGQPRATAVATPVTSAAPKAGSSLKVTTLGTMKGSAAVEVLTFSRDSKLLATAGADKVIKIWEAQSGVPTRTINAQSDTISSLTFLSEGKILAGVTADNIVRFWDVGTGDVQRKLEDYKDNLFTIAVSPDGQGIATGANNDRKLVRVIDPFLGSVKRSFPNHSSWVRAVKFSPSGTLLASTCHDDSVNVLDNNSGRQIHSFAVPGNQDVLAFSADGRLLAIAAENRQMKIYDLQRGALLQTLNGHMGDIKICAFSADGRLLATGSADKTAKIWDVGTGLEKQTLTAHTETVTAVSFSQNDQLLVTAGADQVIKLWEVRR